jgi:hypothetical protein
MTEALNLTDVKKACPQCPFRRDITPGYLGGSPVGKYIGQIIGPFILHCHMHYQDKDYKSQQEKGIKLMVTKPQCAGAAIFRANMKITDRMPEVLHRLPEDHKTCFSNPPEFMAHHERISMYEAVQRLSVKTTADHLREQMQSKTMVFAAVPVKD